MADGGTDADAGARPSDPPLAGTTALVTGAGRRLGRATALALAAAGADVLVHYRSSREAAEETAAAVRARGRRADLLRADLAAEGAPARLAAAAREAAPTPLALLVNNAATFPESRLESLTFETWTEALRVDAWAPFALARAFAAGAEAGCVVNLLDCRLGGYDRAHVAYQLAKESLAVLTRLMALEYAPRVRVGGVAPGLILPPPGEDEAYLARRASSNPMRSHGEAEDVARAVVYLATSPFVTGEILYVDGGRRLLGPNAPPDRRGEDAPGGPERSA